MENKFRNEMEIEVGKVKILLRPTFENIAAMEQHVGSVAWLTWKYSRGTRIGADGKVDPTSLRTESAVKSIPPLTEAAQIIYFNQAATKSEDSTQKKYSLEEIWGFINDAGAISVAPKVVMYLGKMMSGNKAEEKEETSPEEKKE